MRHLLISYHTYILDKLNELILLKQFNNYKILILSHTNPNKDAIIKSIKTIKINDIKKYYKEDVKQIKTIKAKKKSYNLFSYEAF